VDRHKRCKDLTPEYVREKIQRLLAEARLLLAPKIFLITNHREYKLGATGQLMRDVVWAFSKAGKAELKRRINAKRQQL
jgi:hypothetical protein